MPQNPKIVLTPETKTKLTSLKQSSNQSFDQIVNDLIVKSNEIYSVTGQGTSSGTVGASEGEAAFNQYERTLNWIKDTQKKLVGEISEWGASTDLGLTPTQRELAYSIDPLVSGIITPFLRNVLLGTYNIITDDNKKYSDMVDDIETFIKDIEFMEVARSDFENYAIKHGKTYWRKEYKNGKLNRLQSLDSKSIRTYTDPWDSSVKAHHQRIRVTNIWNSSLATSTTEANCWFLPEGETIIEEDEIGNEAAWAKWNVYKNKYNISETAGLRVDAAENIIDMHKGKIGAPAPIDGAVLAIWLKRLVIANSPNVIFNTLIPFMHMQFGVITETIDPTTGQKQIITSVPQQPPVGMATTNPELYTQLLANYNNYETAKKDSLKNLMRYRAENGAFATGPDVKLDIKQSESSISSSFIETMLRQLNEDIGMALGFPVSLVLAKGAELATSRSIKDLFNTVYSGSKQDYERVAMTLIEERFKGQSWNYEIEDLHGEVEKGTYTLEDAQIEFVLGEMDKKDELIKAQTELVTLQSAQIAKAIGASVQDIQAYLDENEMGIWELTNYDLASDMLVQAQELATTSAEAKQDLPQLPGLEKMAGLDSPDVKTKEAGLSAKPNLPSDVKKQSVTELIESTVTATKNKNKKFDMKQGEVVSEKNLKDDLLEAYEAAKESMTELLDGEKEDDE